MGFIPSWLWSKIDREDEEKGREFSHQQVFPVASFQYDVLSLGCAYLAPCLSNNRLLLLAWQKLSTLVSYSSGRAQGYNYQTNHSEPRLLTELLVASSR